MAMVWVKRETMGRQAGRAVAVQHCALLRASVALALTLAALGCGKTNRDGDQASDTGVDTAGASITGVGGATTSATSDGTGGVVDGSSSVTGQVPGCSIDIAPTTQIPRLTREHYDRTLRDLLGVTTLGDDNQPPSSALGPDHGGALTQADWDGYMNAAVQIAEAVMADPELKQNFVKCTPTDDGQQCLHDTIVEFGRRAFRRPLTSEEVARFERFVEQRDALTESGSADEVLELILQTFLVSPSFLQRAELSQLGAANPYLELSGYELATRLSYALWGTTPDAVLLAAADTNGVLSRDQVRTQAERLLDDPRAREQIASFHRYYLGMGAGSRWSTTKDESQFPEWSEAFIPAAIEETERLFDSVAFGPEGFASLFLSSQGFVNQATAAAYGLDPARFDAELVPVELDPELRPGFLTRVGFLSGYSEPNRTSPIWRGSFILAQVLGTEFDTPHTGPVELPSGDEFATNRERFASATTAPECVGCHAGVVDPFGFVLEAYDAIGRWQSEEAHTGAAIDTNAELLIDDARKTVEWPADLMEELAASWTARQVYVQRWHAFLASPEASPISDCELDPLAFRLTEDGATLRDMYVESTQTDAFNLRAKP